MNLLPIVILAGAGFLFLNKKKEVKPTVKIDNSKKPVEFPDRKGYEIINCKTLNITDPTTAFEYAYNLGKSLAAGKTKLPEDMLFSSKVNGQIVNCLTTKESYKTLLDTSEKANFAFEMFKFHYSGLASKSSEQSYMENLLAIRNTFKNFGFDISKMKVEILVP